MHIVVYNILTNRIRGLKSTAGLIAPDTDSHVAISTDILLFVCLFACLFVCLFVSDGSHFEKQH